MKLTSARIRNFRCLRDITIDFSATTIFLGENSTGKSAVLDALRLALSRRWGTRGTGFVEYDFFMDDQHRDPRSGGAIVIDLLFQESTPNEWHEDVTNDLNEIVQTDLKTNINSVHLRTECAFDPVTASFEATWLFLALDGNPLGKGAKRAANISRFFDYVPVFSLAALRDANQEFSTRSSLWAQLLRRINVPDEAWKAIEAGLEELNGELLKADPRMEAIRKSLGNFSNVFAQNTTADVDIRALPLKAWDLVQRAEVIVKGRKDAPWLPLARHGQGIQSLSIIFLFQAYVEQLLEEQYAKHAEPILLLEEPEAHLHPQAARLLGQEIEKIFGQRIVTTHSPFFVERIAINDIRVMRSDSSGATCFALRKSVSREVSMNDALQAVIDGSSGVLEYDVLPRRLRATAAISVGIYRKLLRCYTTPEDRVAQHRLLRRLRDQSLLLVPADTLMRLQDWARRTRGEIFFARLWLLCEGQAEFIFYNGIMDMLNRPLDRDGVAIIDYQNNGNPAAFVSLARALGYPWLLTCDGDDGGKAILAQLRGLDLTATEIAAGTYPLRCADLETLIVTEGLRNQALAVAKTIDPTIADAISDADLAAWIKDDRKIEFASRFVGYLRLHPISSDQLPEYIRTLRSRIYGEAMTENAK